MSWETSTARSGRTTIIGGWYAQAASPTIRSALTARTARHARDSGCAGAGFTGGRRANRTPGSAGHATPADRASRPGGRWKFDVLETGAAGFGRAAATAF